MRASILMISALSLLACGEPPPPECGNGVIDPGELCFFSQKEFSVGEAPRALTVSDLNGDGALDLATSNLGGNTLSVLLGNNNGGFQEEQTFATNAAPAALLSEDIDNDGALDLISANLNAGDVSVLLGNGDGTFLPQTSFEAGLAPHSLQLGDTNNDGSLDLIVANSRQISVLVGNGDGTFLPPLPLLSDAIFLPVEVASQDLDGDGDLDIIFTNADPPEIDVLSGNGDNTFSAPVPFSAGIGNSPVERAVGLGLGDLNQDSLVDVIVANLSGNPDDDDHLSLLLGNGDGSFLPPRSFIIANGPSSVTVGDINQDGKLDAIIVSQALNLAGVLLGDGAGAFGTQRLISVGERAFFAKLGDLDGDSLPELVVTNTNSNNVGISFSNP